MKINGTVSPDLVAGDLGLSAATSGTAKEKRVTVTFASDADIYLLLRM